jgi:hypothetical protein
LTYYNYPLTTLRFHLTRGSTKIAIVREFASRYAFFYSLDSQFCVKLIKSTVGISEYNNQINELNLSSSTFKLKTEYKGRVHLAKSNQLLMIKDGVITKMLG